MNAVEPTRERVEAYEKALGCWWGEGLYLPGTGHCMAHPTSGRWIAVGCPVAVAAARVEAEREAVSR